MRGENSSAHISHEQERWNTLVQQSRVNLAASTRANHGSVIRSLILPTFGAASRSPIEPGHIRTLVADLVADGYPLPPFAALSRPSVPTRR